MTDLRTAAQQALEALEALQGGCTDSNDGTVEAITVWCPEIIDALRAALAEPVQEPVAWFYQNMYTEQEYLVWKKGTGGRNWRPLYPAPPQRKPLETKQLEQIMADCFVGGLPQNWWDWRIRDFARAVERAHEIT